MNYIFVKILILSSVHLLLCLIETFSIEGKYTKNVNNYQIVYPIKVPSIKLIDFNQRSKRSPTASTVHYKLNLGGNDEFVDLEPNSYILSPDAVLEYRTTITSDIDPLINIKLEKCCNNTCFFKGKVRNYDDSSTALSICGGLSGFIRVKRRTYFIEPVFNQNNLTNEDAPHLLYEDLDIEKKPINCATKSDEANDYYFQKPSESSNNSKYLKMHTRHKDVSFISAKPLYIETLLVLDNSMIKLHNRKDAQNYALTVFNMAQSLFHDLSKDPSINLEVVRMIEVEDENDKLNMRKKRQPGSLELKIFSRWQHRINPKKENHPNHHDIAVLLTGNEICDEKGGCHYVGIAETNGACRLKKQAAICKDSGLMLGYIIAHEIAHTLGIDHDSEGNNGCSPSMPDGLSSVMNPLITFKSRQWSSCSRGSLMSTIEKRQLKCFEDDPITKLKIADILPGVFYDADYQCQQLFTTDARNCNKHGDCKSLSCEFEGASCSKTGLMPAQGTACGVNKWCYDGECLEAGKRPKAVQGKWGPWSEWSKCSRTCGAGVSMSTRECNFPPPMHGGKSCIGSRKRHKICTTQPCTIGSHPFRDIQCAEYNDWIFPEDGRAHNWKGFFISSGDPCALYCRNDKDVVVSLSPKVKDGTTCYRGIRDICVDGICRDIPCDLQIDSNSVEDACGLCHGDGTTCNVFHGQINVQEGTAKVVTIPLGTRNIIVEETNPIPSHFILKTRNGNDINNNGEKLGMFNVSGSMGWLGMIKPNQEILEIPGPLTEPVEIWISSAGPQSVTYSMGLPSIPREGMYSWDYIDWSPCMAQCGDSIQESVPKCVELLSGRVEDKYCESIEKPSVKRRSCNAGICFPRWLIGEWQECGPCPNKEAKRFRLVRCIKPLAGSENGIVIINDQICPGIRPIASEHCRCIKRQVVYWQPHNRFYSFSDNFRSNLGNSINKISRSTKRTEKKVTLMQLENENEESMLKQLKENQHKHHSFLYMPHLLESKFNLSIPFKRLAIAKPEKYKDSSNNFYKNKIEGYLKDIPIEWPTIRRKRILHNGRDSDTYFNLTDLRNKVNKDAYGQMSIWQQKEHPTHQFSEQPILKLLSDNLPLYRLKELRKNNEKLNTFNISTNVLADDAFNHRKGSHKFEILDYLMNEFYDILAADAFIQTNINNFGKGHSNSTTILGKEVKIDLEKKKNLSNIVLSFMRKNDHVKPNRLYDPKFHNLKTNNFKNQGNQIINILSSIPKAGPLHVHELKPVKNNFYSNDYNWNPFLDIFINHLSSEHKDPLKNMTSVSEQIFSILPEDIESTTVSIRDQFQLFIKRMNGIRNIPHPSCTHFSDKDNHSELLTRKVIEKLKSFNYTNKSTSSEFLKEVINNLHKSLPRLIKTQNYMLPDDIHSQKIHRMTGSSNQSNPRMNFKYNNNIHTVDQKNADPLRIQHSKCCFYNNNVLPTSGKSGHNFIVNNPISLEDYLIETQWKLQNKGILDKISPISDYAVPGKRESAMFKQSRLEKCSKSIITDQGEEKVIEKDPKIILKCSGSSNINKISDEIISNLVSNLHKDYIGRNLHKIVSRAKRYGEHPFLQKSTSERDAIVREERKNLVSDIITSNRLCFHSTSFSDKNFSRKCEKEINDLSHKKNKKIINTKKTCEDYFEDGRSSEKKIICYPKDIEIVTIIGRIKRQSSHKSKHNCEICKKLLQKFKNKIANSTGLNCTMCETLNAEIAHARNKIEAQEELKKELQELRTSNYTNCYLIYGDEKMTSTPYKLN